MTAPHLSTVRVRYAETDNMGVVYYANYLVWFEVGRTELLREAGWSYREMEQDGVALPVIEARCEYRLPAKYDDVIEIRTTGTALSAVRLRFDYELVRAADRAQLAVGHTAHASVGCTTGRPCRLPERVRALLSGNLDEGLRRQNGRVPGIGAGRTPARAGVRRAVDTISTSNLAQKADGPRGHVAWRPGRCVQCWRRLSDSGEGALDAVGRGTERRGRRGLPSTRRKSAKKRYASHLRGYVARSR